VTLATTAPQVIPPPREDPLAFLLKKQIVVVDDAFDPPPRSQMDDEEVHAFLETCASNAGTQRAFEAVATIPLKEITDLSDDLITLLWPHKWEETELAEALRTTVFADAVDKLANVRPFCEHLRSLKFKVLEIGQAGDIPTQDVALVLVDYVLGREGRGSSEAEALDLFTQAVATSEKVVAKYYHSFPHDADKPFIVLMSSRSAGEVLIETFQKNAKLLRGMFDFVTKTELCKAPILEFKLRTWSYSLPARHHIQHFAEVLSTAMQAVAERFRESLTQLSFQDYTYIQSLALQDDGHPLGDYMLWLYSSFLGDLLLGQPTVIKQREKLDAMEFPAILPTEEPPSTHLAELYQTALGSVSEPLGSHPRQGDKSGEQVATPFAQLGDVFVKTAKDEVYMVLNAACDLAFAPHTARACDPEQAIMLIPGRLTPLYEAPADMKFPRTELFAHDEKLFRVIWRDDRVFSYRHRELFKQMKDSGHERRYRLRLPYALQIQQAFATRLTRVGLPVAPPICVAVDVDLHCADDAGKARTLATRVKGGSFVSHRKHKNEFVQEIVLTAKCVHAIVDSLDEVAEQQTRIPAPPISPIVDKDGNIDEAKQREAEAAQKAQEPARQKKKKDLILSYKAKHDFWFTLVSAPKMLPQPTKSLQLAEGFLSLYRNGTFIGDWGRRSAIVLNIQYGSVPAPMASIPVAAISVPAAAGEVLAPAVAPLEVSLPSIPQPIEPPTVAEGDPE